MLIAHYIPWRAIRAGHQLSDSKGSSAALTTGKWCPPGCTRRAELTACTEAAILCVLRAMRGFVGPKDIFRNPEAIFRQFQARARAVCAARVAHAGLPVAQKTNGDCPFDLVLAHSGESGALQSVRAAVVRHSRSGSDFAVMGMHFKLGLYEHQSAGALQVRCAN
jgi:2-methylcitrate dehydratase